LVSDRMFQLSSSKAV